MPSDEKEDTNPSMRAFVSSKDTGGFDKNRDDKRPANSSARAFDSLVSSNIGLTMQLRAVMFAIIATCVLAIATTAISAYMLHAGQTETRDLLIMISQRPRLCTQVEEKK